MSTANEFVKSAPFIKKSLKAPDKFDNTLNIPPRIPAASCLSTLKTKNLTKLPSFWKNPTPAAPIDRIFDNIFSSS